MTLARPAIVSLALALTACGADDDRPATFSYIQPAILAPSCATVSCHGDKAHAAGVRLDTVEHAWDSLMAVDDPKTPYDDTQLDPTVFVIPGDPLRSKLLYQLRARDTRRMPRDAPLPDADIDLIERWIVAGAPP